MQITVEPAAFKAACTYLGKQVPARPTSPLFAAISIHADHTGATLDSYDLDVAAAARIDVDTEIPGHVLLSGRLLADIAHGLPDSTVHLSTTDTGRVTLRCAGATYRLPIIDATDRPAPPQPPPTAAGSVAADAFASAVEQVAIAASRDETLPALTGVEITADNDTLTLAATDRYRLAVATIPWQPADPSATSRALIRASTLRAAAAGLRHSSSDLRVHFGDEAALVSFVTHDRTLTTRVLTDGFPSWHALLPDSAATSIDADADTLAAALRRCALVTPRNTPVAIAADSGLCTIHAGGQDDPEAQEQLDVVLTGGPLTVYINPQLLLDGISAAASERVVIAGSGSLKPLLLTGDRGAGYRYLLMPIRVKD